MKLNPDCVRDILLEVEESTDYHSDFDYNLKEPCPSRLRKYSHEEILYHVNQCQLSDLILGVHHYDGGNHITIADLSPDGHKFLEHVRQDNIWNGTKRVAEKIGSRSLDVLIQISSNVITELIKAQFGIGLPST